MIQGRDSIPDVTLTDEDIRGTGVTVVPCASALQDEEDDAGGNAPDADRMEMPVPA